MKRSWILLNIMLLSVAGMQLQAQGDVIITVESTTNVTCGGASDGTITVSVSGGTGDYSYQLLQGFTPVETAGPMASSTYTFTGHEKFTNYLVMVSDEDPSNTDGLAWATIGGPDPISITSAIPTDVSCNGLGDGTITVTATGEDGTYTFELTGTENHTNGTGFFPDLLPGTDYVVTVTDDNPLCTSSDATSPMTINDPLVITITEDNVTDVVCYGDFTGSISISPGGGTPGGGGTGYTYSWSGPNGYTSTTEDITNLEAGDYFVTVYDNNMCSASMGPVTVTQATQLTALLNATTDVSCSGGNDGTASMTPGGGAGGYTYLWEGQSGGLTSAAQNPLNLEADTYNLTLSDGDGCSRVFNDFAIINEPPPLEVTVTGTTDVSCPGGADGSAEITPSGGTPSYSFAWSGGTSGYTSSDEDPSGMPADDYNLTLSDDNGCSQVFTNLLTINQPDPIVATVNSTGETLCFGGSDGSADISVSGGTPGYTFLWSGDGTGHTSSMEDPNDLVADTYDLTVTDNNTCSQLFNDLVTIGQPADISVTVDNITDVDCNGDATGAIGITPAGGTAAYSFSWSGPGGFSATTEDISDLETGSYSLTITDSHGCVKDFINVATVNTNTAITATFALTHISCNGGSDGEIDAGISGGSPGYTFDWTGPSGFTASTEDLLGVQAGSYRLTVTDNLGCIEVMTDQVLTEPTPVTATATSVDIDCFGNGNGSVDLTPAGGTAPYTFAWSGPGGFTATTEDITGLEAGSYSVTVTDDNGCPTLFTDIATIAEPADVTLTSSKSDITCAGNADGSIDVTVTGGVPSYTFAWSGPGGYTATTEDIANLEAGTYDLAITDGNGCVDVFAGVETITEPPAITATYVSHTDLLCNGEATGSIEIDITGGSVPLVFDWTDGAGTTVSTDEDPTGLTAGSYSLDISDAAGCSASYPDMVTITEPPPLTISLAGTDIVCYGDGDGTITVTASGGTAPYEYSRLGNLDGAYGPANLFSNLGPGLYTIWTRDANLCVISDTITIHEPQEIQILGETKSGQNLCYGDSLGQISIDAVEGGTEPYLYSINGGVDFFTTHVFTDLPAGDYQTVVQDASGCEKSGNLNVISQPSMLRIDSYVQEDITACYDDNTGRIVVSGSGGNGVITYTLNDTLVNPAGVFQNLPVGPHKVTMEDGNSCMRDTTFVILAPPAIVVDMVSLTHVTGCAGDASGKITVTGSGGTGTLSYNIDGGAFKPNGNFIKQLSGNHTVTLMDDNGCTLDTVVTLTGPDPIVIETAIVTPITCTGANDGLIVVTASGGTPPLNYTLNPGGVTDAGGSFSNLSPDTYTVSVEDAAGCGPVDTSPLILVDPPQFVFDSIVSDSISCNGAGDGSISIYVSEGVRPYTYSVDNQVTWGVDSVITGLTPDTYEVYIRDANGCQAYGGSVTLTNPPGLNLAVTATDITTCGGDSTGSLEATGSGGTGSLEYSLDDVDYQTSGTFINLPGGEHTVYMRDQKGCTLTEQATINEPLPILATITKTDVTYDNLGSITISGATNGLPPYEYSIGGAGGSFSTETVYLELNAGIYHVIVRDMNGCTYEEMVEIMDDPPLNVVVNVAHASCFDTFDGSIEFIPQDAEGAVEFSIDNGETFGAEELFENLLPDSTYLLMARDAAGKVFTGSVTITRPDELTLSHSASPAECNAFSETGAIDVTISGGSGSYTHLWSDGSTDGDRPNIVAGKHIIQTTDENRCTRTDTITVNSWVIVNAYAGKDTTICEGSSIQLEGAGGTIASWSPATFLSYPDSVTTMANGVTEPITYVLTITEEGSSFGCYNTDTVTIALHPETGLEVTQDTAIAQWTSAQLEVVGGPFTAYRWEPAEGLDNSTIPNPVASPRSSTYYLVYATNELGCEEVDSVHVEVIEEIKAYNVFSPNGDGINDYFDIGSADRFPDMVVEVYSRWGDLLFSTTGYDDGSRWDGTARGKEVPMGTYYYVIIPYSGANPITGNVTIIR
ncbi:MAG: gliding motility-associated C-terminal domain-containing protein [Bacteroidota bacterium]